MTDDNNPPSGHTALPATAETLARQAIDDVQPGGAGTLLSTDTTDSYATTYRFSADVRGYRGWEWQVVIAGADSTPTLSEVALMPGDDALLAPEWIPWEDRLAPGDLSDSDVLPVTDDDPRLVPGYMSSGDDELDDDALPIGYGRERVLGPLGRDEAATRWEKGEYGPHTSRAKKAPGKCASCGFYLPLAGALKASFGVCSNRLSADGHVVHANFGCGAHSSVRADYGGSQPAEMYFDDSEFEVIPVPEQSTTRDN